MSLSRARALFVSSIFPSASEAGRGSFNLSQLKALRQAGLAVEVLAVRPRFPLVRGRFAATVGRDGELVGGLSVSYPRVPYLPLSRGRANGWLYAWGVRRPLARAARSFHPDFLWSSFVFPDGVGASRVAEQMALPHVVSVLGSDLNLNIDRPPRLAAIKACLRRTQLVLAKSRALRDTLVACGTPSERILVDYNGVDQSAFRVRDRAQVCALLGESPGCRRVLFVGNLVPVKDPMGLLGAFERLSRKWAGPPLELVFVGDGYLRAALAHDVERRGLKGSVRFLGARSHAEVAAWLGASDLLCLPSRAEGVPNVILEAFAAGRAVVASAVGGIPEVHPGAEAGALVSPGDENALAEALHATLARPPDPARLHRQVQDFTWEANAARIMERLVQLGLARSGSSSLDSAGSAG